MSETGKVIGSIVVACVPVLFLGRQVGGEWTDAAVQVAIADAQGTGSMGGLTQAVAVGAMCLVC